MMPLISVIVPVYKVEEFLKRCVDSILSQTFRDFELFLVDDGSPDNCGEICDEYAEKDTRVIVIHKKNGGLSDARNVALDRASGEYITFIDSDDYVLNNHLESLLFALNETNSDIAIANITSFCSDGVDTNFYSPSEKLQLLNNKKDIFSTIYQPCAAAKLYKRCVYSDIRFPVGRLYEDVFVYHDVLDRSKRICFTGKNSYFYFIRSESIMHQRYQLKFTDIIDALELRIKKIEEIGLTELANDNRQFIYSRVAVAFANLNPEIQENKNRLKEVKDIYDKEYPVLIRETRNPKQKFRYWLLYKFPNFHSKLFGNKMSLALG